MNEELIRDIAEFFGCNEGEASKFLESGRGCYHSIGETNVWLSGTLIHQLIEHVVEKERSACE